MFYILRCRKKYFFLKKLFWSHTVAISVLIVKLFRLLNLISLIKIEGRLAAEPQGFEGVIVHGFARPKAGKQDIFHLTAVAQGQKISSHIAGPIVLNIHKATKKWNLKINIIPVRITSYTVDTPWIFWGSHLIMNQVDFYLVIPDLSFAKVFPLLISVPPGRKLDRQTDKTKHTPFLGKSKKSVQRKICHFPFTFIVMYITPL